MSDWNHLILDWPHEGIAQVTIDRPDQLNALNLDLLAELVSLVTDLGEDDALRAVVFTGAGRAFVAGADIAAMKEMSDEEAAGFGRQGHQAMNTIEKLSVPTIAAVNGFALGGGLELALSCDLIYLSDSARVGLPEVGLGIIPGFGGTQRLGRLIGWQQAKRLIFTGTQLSAEEAVELGLALDALPADELLDEVHSVASDIADNGPIAVRKAKDVMRRGADLTLREGTELELQSFTDLWPTDDRIEGMTAFVEKRDPEFSGS